MAATTFSGGEQGERTERIDYAAILPGRTKAVILAGVMISLFLAALDQTIVATALPYIISDLQGLELLSWVSTSYLLASTAMVPIYGKLSDLYGRRIILLWGILVFLGGSVLCGIAGSMIQLIVYRVIQGIGAAALTSTAFAIPADLFTPAERPRYMGIFGAVFGLSSVLGPYLGGFLTDNWSWRWVFYVNLPVGAVALAFIIFKMPKLASGLRAPIDWLGTVLLVVGVVPLLLGLTLDKNVHGWTSPLILGLFAVAIVATALFLWVEMRAPSPIISLDLFRNRTFAVTIMASVLNGAAFFGAILFLSLFMVNVLGLSATAAGTALIPLKLSLVASSILSTSLVQRFGRYKPMILVGFAIMILGFFLLSRMTVDITPWGVTWRMIVLGLGIGPALPLLNLALQNAVSFDKVGSATASRQFFQQLGQALGAAIFGVVLTTTLSAQLATNFKPIMAQLPPELQSRFDPAQLSNNTGGAEGTAGDALDVGGQIRGEITTQFEQQRTLLTAALQSNDPQAQAALINNTQTPPQLREMLQAGGVEGLVQQQLDQQYAEVERALRSSQPEAVAQLAQTPGLPDALKQRLEQIAPEALQDQATVETILTEIRTALADQQPEIVAQARAAALDQALAGLDQAQAQALEQGNTLGTQITAALRQSFATSVTRIYLYAIGLAAAAFLLVAFGLPELALRTTNRGEAPMPAYE